MKIRIRFMYENSLDSMLTQILESGSISEALQRAEYFQSVVSYDRKKLDEYKATTRKIAETKKQLVAEEESLLELEKEQSSQLEEIDSAVNELKNSLREKLDQIQNSQSLRQKFAAELEQQKAYEAQLERQKAEEDRKRQAEIAREKEELARQRAEEERRRQQEQQQQNRNSSTATDTSGTSNNTTSSNYAASAGDLELMSAIIFCEAGNQSYEGQLAVGSVIMNRVASSSFPNSISGVIYQSGCMSAAQEVLNGRRNVDCLYFCVNNGLIDGLIIGDHVFY